MQLPGRLATDSDAPEIARLVSLAGVMPDLPPGAWDRIGPWWLVVDGENGLAAAIVMGSLGLIGPVRGDFSLPEGVGRAFGLVRHFTPYAKGGGRLCL